MNEGWNVLLWAPLVAIVVSAAYFRAARQLPLARRLLVSAHGLLLVVILMVAFVVNFWGASNQNFVPVFLCAFVLPVFSIWYSMAQLRWRPIHFLQIPNLVSATWIAFVGAMAVGGEWL
jgi:hypothetical protein